MMQRRDKFASRCSFLLLVFGLLALFTVSQTQAVGANAASVSSQRSYAIRALLPNTQIDPQVTYWVLQLKNGQQELNTQVINTGKKPITVTLQANDGITATNAKIVYDKPRATLYPKSTVSFSSLVVGPREKKVTLEPGKVKTVSFTIKAPQETGFSGIILGGIRSVAQVDSSEKGNLMLHQQVQYYISVVLQGKDMNVSPRLQFGQHVTPRVNAGRMVLSIPTTNDKMINASQVTTKVVLVNKANNQVLEKTTQTGLSIAPNSQFNWAFPVKKLASGNYRMHLTVSGRNVKSQTITRDFSISQVQARTAAAYGQRPTQLNMGMIIVLAILIVLLLIGTWVLIYFFAVDTGRNKRLAWEDKRRQKQKR